MCPLVTLLLAVSLFQGDEKVSTLEARASLRPSLVEVCQRACTYLGDSDWKRVKLSIEATRPLAKALGKKWNRDLEGALQDALRGRDSQETLSAVLTLVYWDTCDLLAPMTGEDEVDPKDVRSRLLKARLGLRYLAPMVKAGLAAPGQAVTEREREAARIRYARLEKALVTMIRSLPSDRAYGQDKHWRQNLRAGSAQFLASLQAALPTLHGAPLKKEEKDK